MSLTLCSVCRVIFDGPLVLGEERPHHRTPSDFLKAATTCYICRTIIKSDLWIELERRVRLNENVPPATWFLAPQGCQGKTEDTASTWYKLTIDHDWGERDGELYPPSNAGSDDLPDFYPDTPIWEFRIRPSKDIPTTEKTLPTGLEDPRMLELPKKWYKDCLEHHTLCGAPDPAFRPTRLIEIVNDHSVRLIISKDKDLKESYVAFSHCWGKAKTLKLLEENLSLLQAGISDSDLPTSYREALLVCRSMGFRYIWIDSLCIIQDSFSDWQQEALMMKDVYQNSTLNLCASAAAENSEASFTSRDVSLIPSLMIKPSWADESKNAETWCISLFDMYAEEVENSPLISRAWVVQEHFLSHRSLHMTKSQLWWACRKTLACETYPGGFPKESLRQSPGRLEEDLSELGDPKEDKRDHDARWYRLVEDYARCGLTVSTDKLIAFAGVAQTFTKIFKQDQYMAGMWTSQIPLALCWSTAAMSLTYRPQDYIAPSWSWASVKGVIQMPFIHDRICYDDEKMKTPLETYCEVLDVRVGLKDPRHDTGQVISGQLDLQGHLVGPVNWEASANDGIKIASTPHQSSEFDISFEYGGEVNFDETGRDGAVRMAWFDNSAGDEMPEGTAELTSPPSFLLPIAEFAASSCDPPHAPAMFGIIICKVQSHDRIRYYRVGNFEHLVFPSGILDAFPKESITLD